MKLRMSSQKRSPFVRLLCFGSKSVRRRARVTIRVVESLRRSTMRCYPGDTSSIVTTLSPSGRECRPVLRACMCLCVSFYKSMQVGRGKIFTHTHKLTAGAVREFVHTATMELLNTSD